MAKFKTFAAAVGIAAGAIVAGSAAQAAPVGTGAAGPLAAGAPVEHVQWGPGYGYGYGYGPGPYGGYYGPRRYGPPVVCRFRPTPYGPRRVCFRRY